MITGILITNGGAHSPEQWAYASASMLLEAIKVNPDSPRYVQLELAKDSIRPQIAAVLLKPHQDTQHGERKALLDGDHARLGTALKADEHTDIDSIVEQIHSLVSPLLDKAALFAGGDVTKDPEAVNAHLALVIRERVETDVRTNQLIERSWHADRNPDNLHSRAFRAKFHSGNSSDLISSQEGAI
jgi:hypothetical protein